MLHRAAAALLLAGGALLLQGCTDCGASGGWERVYNPFCVETTYPSRMRPQPPVPGKPG